MNLLTGTQVLFGKDKLKYICDCTWSYYAVVAVSFYNAMQPQKTKDTISALSLILSFIFVYLFHCYYRSACPLFRP